MAHDGVRNNAVPVQEKLDCTHPVCDALLAFKSPKYVPGGLVRRGIIELKSALVRHNYTTASVTRLLGRTNLVGFDASEVSTCGGGNVQRCPPMQNPATATPLAILIQLFLRVNVEIYRDVGHNLGRGRVESVLGKAAVAALLELGVLAQATHSRPVIHANVQLAPYDDGLVHMVTDFNAMTGEFWKQRGLEPVTALGHDTAGLVYGAPRERRRGRLLDLCTGSGVQAIVAAMHYAEDVTLVDFSPRAVRFARFNLLLNGISSERSRVYVGHLYDALPAGTAPFDAILVNPPYLPEPASESIAMAMERGSTFNGAGGRMGTGDGGHMGTKVTSAVVKGAGRWLTAQPDGGAEAGAGSVVRITATIYNHDEYEDWLREWWHEGTARPAEMTMYTGHVWTAAFMKERGMISSRVPGIRTGGNALIWIRQLASAVGGAGSRGGRGHSLSLAQTSFHRSMLHGLLWNTLNSETGLRALMQHWLRLDPNRLLHDYSSYLDADGNMMAPFAAAWRKCTANHALAHLNEVADPRLRLLPLFQQERLLNCVDEKLAQPPPSPRRGAPPLHEEV